MSETLSDLIIVGAGPAGLACAIKASRAGLSVRVLEQGSVADAIRRFPQNMVWFSTPELLSIGDVPFVISTVRPTRVDTLNYYQKVVAHYRLDVRNNDAVVGIRQSADGFELDTVRSRSYKARYVVVATGYFDHPNRLGVPGEDGSNVSHYYDEPYRYFGVDVIVVGGRNSAVEAALDLYRHGARVTLVHRNAGLSPGVKYWILPDIENRIKANEVKAEFNTVVREIRDGSVVVESGSRIQELRADFTFVLVGFRPDASRLRSFGIALDPETEAPLCDTETLESNIPGLYVAGSVIAGRNTNKIFVENGRLHADLVLSSILKKKTPFV